MPYKRGGVRQCVVVNCNNNQKRLYDWENSPCQLHNDLKGKDCPCLMPFKFHCIPASGENRLQWLKSINRKGFDPPPKSVVCSVHFIDGRLSERNPVPVLEMGYQPVTPQTPGRRPLKRLRLDSSDNASPVQSEPHMDPLVTPIKPRNQEMDTTGDILTATPVHNINETFMEEYEQCLPVCCQNYPENCKNVNKNSNSKKPELVDSST